MTAQLSPTLVSRNVVRVIRLARRPKLNNEPNTAPPARGDEVVPRHAVHPSRPGCGAGPRSAGTLLLGEEGGRAGRRMSLSRVEGRA